MTLSPSPVELRARALTDLRMGLPVVIDMPEPLVVCAAETLTQDRLDALRSLGEVQAVLSKWRADTLKVNAYDGDVARISVPPSVDARWCQAVADPMLDLSYPMKGPFQTLRGGPVDGQRLAVALLKAAHLLPMAITVHSLEPLSSLTHLPVDILLEPGFALVVSAQLPLEGTLCG